MATSNTDPVRDPKEHVQCRTGGMVETKKKMGFYVKTKYRPSPLVTAVRSKLRGPIGGHLLLQPGDDVFVKILRREEVASAHGKPSADVGNIGRQVALPTVTHRTCKNSVSSVTAADHRMSWDHSQFNVMPPTLLLEMREIRSRRGIQVSRL